MKAIYREVRLLAKGGAIIVIVHDSVGVRIGVQDGLEVETWAVLDPERCAEIAEEIAMMAEL